MLGNSKIQLGLIIKAALIAGFSLSSVHANGPEDVQVVREFIKSYSLQEGRVIIRRALAYTPQDERVHIITAAKPLLRQGANDYKLIENLGKIRQNARDKVVRQFKESLNTQIDWLAQDRLWRQLIQDNRNQREIPKTIPDDIAEAVKPLLNDSVSLQNLSSLVIDALNDIIPSERAHVIECVQRVIRNSDGFQTASLIDVLGLLSRENREVVMPAAEPVLKDFFQDRDGDEWAAIIELLSEIPMDRLSTMTTSQKLIFLIEKDKQGEFSGYREPRYLTPMGGGDIDTGAMPISRSISFALRVKWQQCGEWVGYLREIHSW